MIIWKEYLKERGMKVEDLHIVYVGVDGMSFGAGSETRTKPGAPHYWRILEEADLIITNHKINCYPIHVPVIDLKGECINKRDRDVIVDEEIW